jgi:hypothetical protein
MLVNTIFVVISKFDALQADFFVIDQLANKLRWYGFAFNVAQARKNSCLLAL